MKRLIVTGLLIAIVSITAFAITIPGVTYRTYYDAYGHTSSVAWRNDSSSDYTISFQVTFSSRDSDYVTINVKAHGRYTYHWREKGRITDVVIIDYSTY